MAKAKTPTKPTPTEAKAPKRVSLLVKRPPKPKRAKKQKELAGNRGPLPTAGQLMLDSWDMIRQHWFVLGGIMVVYLVLYLLFARPGGLNDVAQVKDLVTKASQGQRAFVNDLVTLGIFISASGAGSSGQTAPVSALWLFLVVSLVIIWALRALNGGEKIRIRDAYYRGLQPLIPFLLLLLLIGFELIPFIVGGSIYGIAKSQGIIAHWYEEAILAGLWLVLACLSLYWMVNSIMSLYAVTLPGAYPFKTLKKMRTIVRGRRWFILRKMLLVPLVVALIGLVIGLLCVQLVPHLLGFVLMFLGALAILYAHTYFYLLYRSLI